MFNNTYGIGAVASSTVVLTNSTIMLNTTGVVLVGGSVYSFGNNRISGNLNGNGPLSGLLNQQ